MSTDDRLERLERFFKKVAYLAVNHEVIAGEAVTYPSALGESPVRLWNSESLTAAQISREQLVPEIPRSL